jgi:Phage minor capsid protein 2.
MDPLNQQQLSTPIVEVYLAIEEQILINIAKRLSKHRSLLTEDDILSWQTEQLSLLGDLSKENIKTIAQHAGLTADEVKKMLREAGYGGAKLFEGEMHEAAQMGLLTSPVPVESSAVLEGILLTYQAQALDTFNLVNTTLLQQSQQAALDIINQTVGKVMAGVSTPKDALREVAGKWANEGIPALIDKAGKRWSTEGYVNMVTRATSNNIANDMQFARMDEYDCDLTEVSSHLGARPRCAPFQGRIYSRSGNHKKYPSLKSTSYGEIAGLKGINCHHVFYPFIEGLSKQRFQPYDAEKNEIVYEQTQQQRYLERDIRKSKRELAMMDAMQDEKGVQLAKQKVREKQANMREFINESGLTRQYSREKPY